MSGGTSAMAAPVRTEVQAAPAREFLRTEDFEGWRLFGGAGLGFNAVRSRDYEKAPMGPQYNLSALMGYQAPSWVLDLGASWFYSALEGRNSGGLPIDIRTYGATIDLSPRYRVTRRFQLGPVLNAAFGTDTQLGPSVGKELGAFYVGLRAAYEFQVDRFPVRLWQQATTDASIRGREALIAMVGIQVGFPLSVAPDKTTVNSAEPYGRVLPMSGIQKRLRLVLDPQKVFFSTDSSQLKPGVKTVLADVGNYLATHPDQWSAIDVSGHADQRGRYKYNLKLSRARAGSVARAISQGGLAAAKTNIEAHSFTKPIDAANTPQAWAKNRRVELIIKNVADAAPLIAILKPLLHQKPGDERMKK